MELNCKTCGLGLISVTKFMIHQRFHSNAANYRFHCGFQHCNRIFKTQAAFRAHVHRNHQIHREPQIQGQMERRCDISDCRATFDNMKDLISHLCYHIRMEGCTVTCPYNNCQKQFKKRSSFSSHLSRNHFGSAGNASTSDVNSTGEDNTLNNDWAIQVSENLRESDVSMDTEELADTASLSGRSSSENLSSQYVKELSLFFMKLQGKCLLPASVIQDIITEMDAFHEVDCEILAERLTRKMESLGISQQNAMKVISEMDACDPWKKNVRGGPLSTTYQRQKYFTENFAYIKPVEVRLGPNAQQKERSFQYIPILRTLKAFVERNSAFISYPKNLAASDSHNVTFKDIHDGSVFKNNILFRHKALQLLLYQDAFEVVNPLGSARGKHKVIGTYFTLANIAAHNRSSVDHIQLVSLCIEKDLKEFGVQKVYQTLIDDLKTLETTGLDMGEEEPLLGTVVAVLGDNLGSHGLGGYVESFSATHSCRYCLVSRTELLESDMPIKGQVRTPENYNTALAEAHAGGLTHFHGVKQDSVLNQLRYYHVAQPGMPPCLAHDLFEGVVSLDLPLIINVLIKEKKWLTYSQLNERIAKFPYQGADALDKPCPLSESYTHITGHAVQNWVFLRLLPLILHPFVQNKADPLWGILLKLKEIVEMVCTPNITELDVAYLQVCIEEYLFDRKLHFPNCNLKPKHHYLYHYPELILAFGPLIRLWTLRFESKHSYFKRCARKLQNFVNLPKTLAERHQILQAYYNAGSLFTDSLDLDAAIPFDQSLYNDDIQKATRDLNLGGNAQILSKVKYRNVEYKKGMYLVIRYQNERLLFGEIISVIIHEETNIYFLVKLHQSKHILEMGVYEISQGSQLPIDCVSSHCILDYCPLPAYRQGNNLFISMKNFVGKPSV